MQLFLPKKEGSRKKREKKKYLLVHDLELRLFFDLVICAVHDCDEEVEQDEGDGLQGEQ